MSAVESVSSGIEAAQRDARARLDAHVVEVIQFGRCFDRQCIVPTALGGAVFAQIGVLGKIPAAQLLWCGRRRHTSGSGWGPYCRQSVPRRIRIPLVRCGGFRIQDSRFRIQDSGFRERRSHKRRGGMPLGPANL